MDRRRSETRIAEVIAELSADIVGLQELDLSRKRSGGVDQAGLIAAQLGWHHYFHPAIRTGDEHYGDAVLSRYPLTLRRAGDLPGPAPFYCRENRVAILVDVATPVGPVQIINTHFGLGRSERLLQAEHRALAKHLRDVRELVDPASSFRTYPTSFPSFAVDHIFINAALHPLSLEVHKSPLARVASDHYPLVCELVPAETANR